jgi:hypothetical protein
MTDDLEAILGQAAKDAEQPDLPKDHEMRELSQLCQELTDIRRRIEKGEELLKALKADEQKLSNFTIPDKMDELGVKSITLPDNRKVSYKPFYSGKIKPEREPEAFDWLESHDHGGVIKGELVVPYRRPEREDILKLKAVLENSYGRDVDVKLSVHHSTMRALIREVVEGGGAFPPDLFDVFIGRKTELK